MTLAVVLAGLAAAAVVGLPRPGAVRVRALTGRSPRASGRPARELRLAAPGAALLAGGVALVAVGPVPALLLAGGVVLAARALAERRLAAGRAQERVRAVEACATLAAELRAGRAAAEALAAAADVASGGTREALAAAAAAARAGADVPAALAPAGQPPSAVPELLRGLAACWAVCAAAGSGLAGAVDRLEEGLRAAQAQRRAVEAELAGPKATAALLAGLPLAGIALAAGLGADPLRVLLHTPAGLFCLVAGVALDLVGLRWTARMVARAAEAA
jgi:tight adherence protein B